MLPKANKTLNQMHFDAVNTLHHSQHLYSFVEASEGERESPASSNSGEEATHYYYYTEKPLATEQEIPIPVALEREKAKHNSGGEQVVTFREEFLLSPEGEVVLANGAFGVPEV